MDSLINKFSEKYEISTTLIKSIIQVESSGNTSAHKYEPEFYTRYVKNRNHPVIAPCSRATEEHDRATSFGLMQVMGQTARELGFDKAFLTELCIPEVGIEYGCMLLKNKINRYKAYSDFLERAIVAYNAGSAIKTPYGKWKNQDYLEKIKKAGGF